MFPLANASNLSLVPWQSFYVLVGSSAGALIGLQFVVIALIAGTPRFASMEAINAFGTPTVVHFSIALIISAVMNVPWLSLGSPAVALAFCGVGGLFYCAIIVRRAGRQTNYRLIPEDWIWYVSIPILIYLTLAAASVFLWSNSPSAIYAIAGVALALLLIGIRNAWDTVTHIATLASEDNEAKSK